MQPLISTQKSLMVDLIKGRNLKGGASRFFQVLVEGVKMKTSGIKFGEKNPSIDEVFVFDYLEGMVATIVFLDDNKSSGEVVIDVESFVGKPASWFSLGDLGDLMVEFSCIPKDDLETESPVYNVVNKQVEKQVEKQIERQDEKQVEKQVEKCLFSFSARLMVFGLVDAILGILTLTLAIIWKTVWRSPFDATSSVLLLLAIVFLITGILSLVAGVWFNIHQSETFKRICGQTLIFVSLMFVGVVIVGASLNALHTEHTGAVFKLHFEDYAEEFKIDSRESLKKIDTESARVTVPIELFFLLLPITIAQYVCALVAFPDGIECGLLVNIGSLGPIFFCICGIVVVFSLQMISVRTPSDYGRTFTAPITNMAIVSIIMFASLVVAIIVFSLYPFLIVAGIIAAVIVLGCIGVTVQQLVWGYSREYDNWGCAADSAFDRVCNGECGECANDTDIESGTEEARDECRAKIMRSVYRYNLLTEEVAPLEPHTDPPCYNLYNMTVDLVKAAQKGARDLHIGAAWLSVFGLFVSLAEMLLGFIALLWFCRYGTGWVV